MAYACGMNAMSHATGTCSDESIVKRVNFRMEKGILERTVKRE